MILKKTFISPYSEQNVLNCMSSTDKWRSDKCDGGTEIEVFDHAESTGLKYEFDVNYTGRI